MQKGSDDDVNTQFSSSRECDFAATTSMSPAHAHAKAMPTTVETRSAKKKAGATSPERSEWRQRPQNWDLLCTIPTNITVNTQHTSSCGDVRQLLSLFPTNQIFARSNGWLMLPTSAYNLCFVVTKHEWTCNSIQSKQASKHATNNPSNTVEQNWFIPTHHEDHHGNDTAFLPDSLATQRPRLSTTIGATSAPTAATTYSNYYKISQGTPGLAALWMCHSCRHVRSRRRAGPNTRTKEKQGGQV